ncbi:hypothetical protein [Nocardia arthritidis]|uniref:Uncharacterized protein n=1 Tax=Nocardia arthritidis TaxID=228602 RepID=A0A6G9YM62_9NOCA|nr:hypothetical protein [Nocardia arthritidis]QIS14369.1 hypothetical protein F5544_32660 [Nocardia arthritidis]
MTVEFGDHAWYWNGNVSSTKNIPRAQWFPGSNPSDPTDYQGHGVEIYNYVFYDNNVILRGQPHLRHGTGSYAWLNNNPGNLTGVAGGPDYGQYPGKFNWHNFLIFPDYDTGFLAIGLFLQSPAYIDLSIQAAFRKYAPASDGNDPDTYAADVAAAAGVDVSTPISDLTAEQMSLLQNKIAQIEGAVPGDTLAYDSDDLPQAIKDLIA